MNRLEVIRQEIAGEWQSITAFARTLRQTATHAEILMWRCLRNRRMNGRKFRRQHPIEPFIVDFYCEELSLAVELDGGQHNSLEGHRHDAARDDFLRELGVKVLRFTNGELFRHTDAVLNVIWHHTRREDDEDTQPGSASPSPRPSPQGRGG